MLQQSYCPHIVLLQLYFQKLVMLKSRSTCALLMFSPSSCPAFFPG